MARHVLPISEVKLTKDPERVSAPPVPSEEKSGTETQVAQPENEQGKTWAFVKNFNTKEKITFDDGETFVFPSALFVTADKAFAEKMLQVAQRYNVVLQ